MSETQQTPLHDWHVARGGKMVDFAGWRMPVQYTGLVDEHTAVRERAGLFDVSHMGEIRVTGADALANVQRLTVNDAAPLEIGQAQYTAMVSESGGMVDDLLVYRVGETNYLLVVNAGTTEKDFAWIESRLEGDVTLTNESAEWAQLALQGPAAARVLGPLFDLDLSAIRYYRFAVSSYSGATAIVSRTGYTGEDGFEVYLAADLAPQLADAILAAGSDVGVVPAGLGARDTLRLEAGMLLYGSDMDDARSPIEARLGWIVKTAKGDFVGRDALVAQKSDGTAQQLVGLEVSGRGIPRHGYAVLDAGGNSIGEVTSGTFSPTLKKGIGLAYVNTEHAGLETVVAVAIRANEVPARVVKPPFYRRDT